MIIIIIDGRSGSGKTTLAAELAQQTGFQLVHLDDFYPGWNGLAAARTMVSEDVLDPLVPGFWRWDWEHDRRGNWQPLIPGRSLIVEGAGALSPASISAASALGQLITVRMSGPERVRRERALARDPDYEPWWEIWAAQERVHFAGPGAVLVDHEFEC